MEHSLPTGSQATRIKVILLMTSFFALLNETSVNVALMTLAQAFHTDVTTVQWLVTGFMLVMSVVVPVTAFILHSYSTRKIYFSSLSLLIVGSVMAGFAPNFAVLLTARMVQAAGNCVLMSLTVTTMIHLTPPEKRGSSIGLIGLVTLFAPAVAPSLSGFVLQTWGWPWIFLFPLPIFLVLFILATRMVTNVSATTKMPLDLLSVGLSILGFGGLLLAISQVETVQTSPGSFVIPLAVGVAAVVLFIVRQLTTKHPLLDVRVFKNKSFSLAMILIFFGILSVFGITILTPMYLGQELGLTTALVGLAMLPGGLLNGFLAPVTGMLHDKWGARPIIIPGVAVLLAVTIVLALLPSGLPLAVFMALHVIFLAAMAFVMTPAQTLGMNQLTPSHYAHGTAAMSTLMQLGGGFGTAIYVTSFAWGQKTAGSFLGGFHSAFFWGALLLLIPLVAALLISARKPSAVLQTSQS